MIPSGSRVAMIHSGGGFFGVYGIGFYKAVYARNFRPACIQGVSVGALNAARIVQDGGDPEGVLSIWLDLIERKGPAFIFDRRVRSIARHMAEDGYPLSSEGIKVLVDSLDLQKVINSPIGLQILTFNKSQRKRNIFSNRDQSVIENPELLRKAILASASIAGIFPPVIIQGELHCDPEMFSVEPLLECDNGEKILVFVNSPRLVHLSDSRLVRFAMEREHNLYELFLQTELAHHAANLLVFRLEEGVTTLKADHFERGDMEKAVRVVYSKGLEILEHI